MYQIVCEDIPSINTDGTLECGSSGTEWQVQLSSLPFDSSQIDATTATYLFGSGIFLSLAPIMAAFGASFILGAIRGKR